MSKKINISKTAIWLIAAIVVFCVGQVAVRYYRGWRLSQDLWIFTEEGMSTFLKSDTYGGDTPQETYEMFVMALKNNDIDSARKFFYWRYQEIERKKFEDLKSKGTLENYIQGLPKWEELEEEEEYNITDEKKYVYNYVQKEDKKYYDELMKEWDIFPKGKYKAWIGFYFNIYSKVWKIYEKL